MGIRRQIKPHRNSISFAGLLHEIVKTPYILSRERFVALYERNSHYEANHDFGQFAREDAEYIDSNKVRQDLDKLKKLGRAVEVFADKRIAHYDKQLVENVPSFGELDDCINFLAELTGIDGMKAHCFSFGVKFRSCGKDQTSKKRVDFRSEMWYN